MANSRPAETMQIIVDSLRSNPSVVTYGLEFCPVTRRWLPPQDSPDLDILLHPKDPIYNPEELNDFMFKNLAPIEPTRCDYFAFRPADIEQSRPRLMLGRLCFDETVANTALSARALQRCTSLRLFPDAGHLMDALDGRNQHDIPMDELGLSQAAA